jgi:thiopeptide-type bacteriocin biosynthesis protein
MQLDTYEREIERYGGDQGMLLAEQLFCVDSETVVGLLDAIAEHGDPQIRWQLALRGLDLMLDDFGVAADDRRLLYGACRRGLAREFRADGGLDRQIGAKFRSERRAVEALLDLTSAPPAPLAPGLAILAQRSARLQPVVAALRAHLAAQQLTTSWLELAMSHLHMHANRLFPSAGRAHELVLYDFLERVYEGRSARKKTGDAASGGSIRIISRQ